jgi:NAD(P)-dependent dehydrogenase (short-subunit alcohol dehydrogenase family)
VASATTSPPDERTALVREIVADMFRRPRTAVVSLIIGEVRTDLTKTPRHATLLRNFSRDAGDKRTGRDLVGNKIDFGLDGKVAIVTGGGSRTPEIGNGRAAAILLARAGARVAVLDVDAGAAERTVEMISGEGGTAVAVTVDVGDEKSCGSAVREVRRELGPVYALVNNVGLEGPAGTVVDVDVDGWRAMFRVNVDSVLFMSRACVPEMEGNHAGVIVNMSSAAGLLGGNPRIAYAATKGTIPQLTRAMAAHHGVNGVRVNCVAPGMVYTPMVSSRGMSEETREQRRRRSLLQTEGTGWDVGNAVLFLCSDLSRWITGQTIPVDAGYTAGKEMPAPPVKS